jgi:hypothetical protein
MAVKKNLSPQIIRVLRRKKRKKDFSNGCLGANNEA